MKAHLAKIFLFALGLASSHLNPAHAAPATTSLAGSWRFQLDPQDRGLTQQFFQHDLPQTITLPGILQAQGYGNEISTNTPWVLSLYDKLWFERADYQAFAAPGQVKVPFVCQPQRHYLGAAWYQRDIEIPKDWEGRRVVLFLERTRWETRAWLDDKLISTNNSLCTPHEFDFGIVAPGKHRVTVRVDNRMLLNYRPDAHAVSDSLGSTWNGIVGKIELRSTPPVWIETVQVFSDIKSNDVTLKITMGNRTGKEANVSLQTTLMLQNPAYNDFNKERQITVPISGGEVVSYHVLSPHAPLWDEFQQEKASVLISLRCGDSIEKTTVDFGVRDFKSVGQEFSVNGRPSMLRGTHHGGDFPLTGYPPCDVEYWQKLFSTCKEWGLNHMRFHSFCPPEAAFTAADEIGIYLQIEPGMWNEISPGTPMERTLYDETERIIKYYGNHPSFVLLSPSNEPKGRWKESLPKWVAHFRERDPRHLYTTGTGWSLIDEPGPVADKVDYLAVHRIGQNMMRGNTGWFGRDYARALRGVDVPNLAHELGQWVAYPDFDVIKKFTGFIRPGNYEIFRDSAAANSVLEYNKEFAHASGRFQLACYKEEIEANLRTPGLGGFQLLDLHDYTGQGTALVGLLDPFWEAKGYVTPKEFRKFCGPVTPLIWLPKRVFTTDEQLEADVGIANFGRDTLKQTYLMWIVYDTGGKKVAGGYMSGPTRDLAVGFREKLYHFAAGLKNKPAPAQYKLVVGNVIAPENPTNEFCQNDWNFWVFPTQVSTEPSKDVLVTSSWSEAEKKLAAGGKVLFLPRNADLDWASPPLDNVPVFWNRLMSPQWGRMLGLWCDVNHPALAGFPTEANCDWQWTQITKGTRAVNLAKLPGELKPIVAAIDDWNRNWKLAPIFEVKVGPGKLLVCSFDVITKLHERIVARQLRRSLLDYAASEKFQPKVAVTAEQVRALWFDTLVMAKLGATVSTSSGNGRDAIDGDPNTAWVAGGRGRGTDGRTHPHTLTITFTNAVAMNGVVLMNRQNDRDHLGDIREYRIETSDDGERWRSVLAGQLPSTWSPQTIHFPKIESAKQLRFTALSGYGTDASAASAEIAVLYAGPRLAENADAVVEYKRIRSTSTDVDEGAATPAETKPKR